MFYEPEEPLSDYLLGDEKRLRQILIKLIGNAIKFTPEGRVIFRVSLQKRPEGSRAPTVDDVARVSDMATLCFEIEDSGIGIPSEKLSKIFRPFEQVNDPRIQDGGTGLGLAISAQIAQLMGSEIQVESTPGEGSRFWLELSWPVANSRMSVPVLQAQHIVGIKNRSYTLLLVDDHESNRQVLREMLEPLGFECAEAGNGEEALQHVQLALPDLILLDLKMPVMDGYEALPRLRDLNASAHVPIIAVSAEAHCHMRQHVLERGFDDFLSKPLRVEELLKSIEQCLQLEWRYEDSSTINPSAEAFPPLLPPQEELAGLERLATIGDIMEVRRCLDRLEGSDPAFGPFVKQLREMNENFELNQLQNSLRQYLAMSQPYSEEKHPPA